jgi:hypothetical protein
MVIEPKMIVGSAAAFALVGAAFWGGALLMPSTSDRNGSGTVEISLEDKAWMVEVHDEQPGTGETLAAANR